MSKERPQSEFRLGICCALTHKKLELVTLLAKSSHFLFAFKCLPLISRISFRLFLLRPFYCIFIFCRMATIEINGSTYPERKPSNALGVGGRPGERKLSNAELRKSSNALRKPSLSPIGTIGA